MLSAAKHDTSEDDSHGMGYGILCWLPDLYRVVLCAAAIAAGGGDIAAIGRPGQGVDIVSVALVGEDVAAVEGVPDLHGIVAAGGGHTLAIRRPGNSIDGIAVAVIGEDGFAARRVPDLDGIIQAAGGDIFAIGRPGNGKDGIAVTAIGQKVLAGG